GSLIAEIIGKFSTILGSLINIISIIIYMLLELGLVYIGIQRAKNVSINFKQVFRAFEFPIILRVIGVYFLIAVILISIDVFFFIPIFILVGTSSNVLTSGFNIANFFFVSWLLIAIIAIIYISIRMMLSIAFVLDRGTNSWSAIKMSFKA